MGRITIGRKFSRSRRANMGQTKVCHKYADINNEKVSWRSRRMHGGKDSGIWRSLPYRQGPFLVYEKFPKGTMQRL